ncbi:hypothetical protein EYF88_13365 [Paracoccus sediminis]|uniref:Uncharacterized protein n=1 Tax=Paracoccus sediminis TaxID=1214787 RepID=A0ABY1YG77_9RHOB|nr:hypothetical protein [Paracoccus sediminis]TBN48490.1 hypothetical protein EYF88_13365 [Paracoccus sediminis]
MVGIIKFEADKLFDLILSSFQEVETPVAIRELASLYGILAAQQEALLAIYELMMKARPDLSSSEEAADVEKAMSRAAEIYGNALMALARSYIPSEGGDE